MKSTKKDKENFFNAKSDLGYIVGGKRRTRRENYELGKGLTILATAVVNGISRLYTTAKKKNDTNKAKKALEEKILNKTKAIEELIDARVNGIEVTGIIYYENLLKVFVKQDINLYCKAKYDFNVEGDKLAMIETIKSYILEN